jgi:phage tail-like protein
VDVNGTRFHLIKGKSDWLRCREEGAPHDGFLRVYYDERSERLTLKPVLSLFPRRSDQRSLDPLVSRRGAAVDRFGNFYWIANDRQRIFWQPSGTRRAHVYWTQKPAPCCAVAGEFRPVATVSGVSELAGLAVTEHHYLVVGDVSRGGLWVFDLHAGGEPMLLLFPDTAHLEPFDMAAAPGGGLWVLDHEHHVYWGLDRDFRVLGATVLSPGSPPSSDVMTFHSVGQVVEIRPDRRFPTGFPIAAQNPISIEALPDGSVLILDSPLLPMQLGISAVPSTLYHYRGAQQVSMPVALKDQVEVETADVDIATTTHILSIVAHDITYDPDSQTLYAAERAGKQAIAFALTLAPTFSLKVRTDYLPMHFFGGRALVLGGELGNHKVYYDVVGGEADKDTAVRWAELQAIDEPHYAREAVVLTRIFDGKERNCVWDALFLDACIPPEAAVRISSRADNDPELIESESAPFMDEPNLYLRGAGAEIPYYVPFVDLEARTTGTWELLFQRARGRYLQIRLELIGNGRVTPELHALRAYYPRFSYPEHYLPAVYREDQESASFLERLLANPKGFFTEIEGRINDVSILFDPRSTSEETLNWLASWIGLAFDPLWGQIHKRRSLNGKNSDRPVFDRRRLFIRFAPELYERRGTPNGIRLALQLLLDPCLEEILERFQAAVLVPNFTLREELHRLDLPYPTLAMTAQEIEELMFTYVLASYHASKVRIVERFMARDGRAVAAGDPTRTGGSTMEDTLEGSAHRFSVLIAEGLPTAEAAMVQHIVELERPAHTIYDVRRFWDYFRVGEARLGIDTVLGEESRFVPIILGRNTLAEGYLYPAPPMDTPERVVLDRDQVGELPTL